MPISGGGGQKMITVINSRVLRTTCLLLITILLCPFACGKVIYVDDDATGLNDGTNWANAYTYLQDALADANDLDKPVEIRVAQGTYRPNQGLVAIPEFDWRSTTFQLINGVSLKGGYAGIGKPDPNAHAIEIYETILSGDLNIDDIEVTYPCDLSTEPTRAENSRNVVTGSGTDVTAIIDGFTIKGGNANGPSWQQMHGGGLINMSGHPTIINCTFVGNVASRRGGGIYNFNSNPVITGCKFIENTGLHGGGICNNNSIPEIEECYFENNMAENGGGVSNAGSDAILTKCTFISNFATVHGGGVRNISSGNPIFTNCIFTSNQTEDQGGGMFNQETSSIIINCIFTENRASLGGGIVNISNSTATIVNCTFSDNIAKDQAGGMYNYDASPIVTGCTFSRNSADNGAGMANFYNCNTTVTNCSFMENMATDHGGGISNNSASPTVRNCLFKGNRAIYGGGMENFHYSNATIARCTFSSNIAGDQGGGIYNNEAAPNITNCLFSGNSALSGAGIGNFYSAAPVIVNCTFSDNMAEIEGGGIQSIWYSNPILKNCILWFNPSPSKTVISCAPDSSTTISYSNVEGRWPGQGNIDTDPFFVHHGYWADVNDANIVVEPNEPNAVWIDGDYHIKSQAGRWDPNSQIWVIDDVTSSCIDAGDPNDYVAFEPYINGGIINMGTYGGTLEASKSISGPFSGMNQYMFLPELSTLVQTGGIAGVSTTYGIEGKFQLTIDLTARTAIFSQIDVVAIDDGPPIRELDLNQEFSFDSLVGFIADDGTIDFSGKADNNSDIILKLTFSDDLVHFTGETIPPEGSADFFVFHLDASAQPEGQR
jgi:predicted outer membrane repeat protein